MQRTAGALLWFITARQERRRARPDERDSEPDAVPLPTSTDVPALTLLLSFTLEALIEALGSALRGWPKTDTVAATRTWSVQVHVVTGGALK